MLIHFGTLFAMSVFYHYLTHYTRLWYGFCYVCAREIVSRGTLPQNKMFHVKHNVK